MSFTPCVQCTMPIPQERLGLVWGSLTAPVQVCFYLDPLCHDCAQAYRTLDKLIPKYQDRICFIGYMFSLPYHTWSFVIQRTITAVKSICPDKAKILFADLYKNSQLKLTSEALAGKSEDEVIETVQKWASSVSGISFDEIKAKYKDSAVLLIARAEFKCSCQNGITATPHFFINGARTAIDEQATMENWASVLEPLL